MTSDNNNSNFCVEEVQVTLKLKKSIAEVVRILALCYTGPSKEDFDNFISEEVTKIVTALAENLPEPPYFPESFKQYVKELLLKEDRD